MKKSLVIRISAALLVLWYAMCVIGFDVHTCSGSGRSFVATFVTGLSCSDIHPDHHCCHSDCCADIAHGCCSHGEEPVLEPSACCTDDFQVLDLTGSNYGNRDSLADHHDLLPVVEITIPELTYLSASFNTERLFHVPDSGVCEPGDIQSVLGIWRI